MNINKELLKGSTVILILKQLEQQPMYGYEMIAAISRDSNGIFNFREGTLYPILHALESEGFVESYWIGDEGTRRRKYYRITGEGRHYLEAKRREWVIFRTAVDQVLGEDRA